jgi:hypothetical protein
LTATDAAVDVEVDGGEYAEGASLEASLDASGIMVVIEERDLLTDKTHWGLVEPAIEGDGAVLGHAAFGGCTEVIFEVFWGGTDAVHMVGEAFEGACTCGGVGALVVDVADPALKAQVEIMKGSALEA